MARGWVGIHATRNCISCNATSKIRISRGAGRLGGQSHPIAMYFWQCNPRNHRYRWTVHLKETWDRGGQPPWGTTGSGCTTKRHIRTVLYSTTVYRLTHQACTPGLHIMLACSHLESLVNKAWVAGWDNLGEWRWHWLEPATPYARVSCSDRLSISNPSSTTYSSFSTCRFWWWYRCYSISYIDFVDATRKGGWRLVPHIRSRWRWDERRKRLFLEPKLAADIQAFILYFGSRSRLVQERDLFICNSLGMGP